MNANQHLGFRGPEMKRRSTHVGVGFVNESVQVLDGLPYAHACAGGLFEVLAGFEVVLDRLFLCGHLAYTRERHSFDRVPCCSR